MITNLLSSVKTADDLRQILDRRPALINMLRMNERNYNEVGSWVRRNGFDPVSLKQELKRKSKEQGPNVTNIHYLLARFYPKFMTDDPVPNMKAKFLEYVSRIPTSESDAIVASLDGTLRDMFPNLTEELVCEVLGLTPSSESRIKTKGKAPARKAKPTRTRKPAARKPAARKPAARKPATRKPRTTKKND